MPPDPPAPRAAHDAGLATSVLFDQFLNVGVLNVANWSVRFTGQRYTIATADVGPGDPTQVNLLWVLPGVPDAGPDVVDYTPPPFDVVSAATGLPAVGFLNFPITPIPPP